MSYLLCSRLQSIRLTKRITLQSIALATDMMFFGEEKTILDKADFLCAEISGNYEQSLQPFFDLKHI